MALPLPHTQSGRRLTIEIGQVEAVFRHPVRPMAGERHEAVTVGWHGIEGDRRLAPERAHRPGAFQEDGWLGRILTFGEPDEGPRVNVTTRDLRCSMVNLDAVRLQD